MSFATVAVAQAEVLCRAIVGVHPDPDQVVTAVQNHDGSDRTLSVFGDSVWELPSSMFPRNTSLYARRISFEQVPASLCVTLKLCILRYYLYGQEGCGRPRGATIFQMMKRMCPFLQFIDKHGFGDLQLVTPMLCHQYVEHCRREGGRNGAPLLPGAQSLRFLAVEALHRLSQFTSSPMPHPWPESSAYVLSGIEAPNKRASTTLVIPDDVLGRLFRHCEVLLDRADRCLEFLAMVRAWQKEFRDSEAWRSRLNRAGYAGDVQALRDDLYMILRACVALVLLGSGIRSHELSSLDADCCSEKSGDDGEKFYWISGRSEKTGDGACSWLVPAIVHRAIGIAARITAPLRADLIERIEYLLASDPTSAELSDLMLNKDAVFITQWSCDKYRIKAMSLESINSHLKSLAKHAGIDWVFSSHQFRRTFAVYAARSILGDLRYLRGHFKHWSLDMTAYYAAAQDKDEELFDEIGIQLRKFKVEVVEHWLEKDTLLSGGMAGAVRTFRDGAEAVETYATRSDLAMKLSDLVSIRATGVAWCTADSGGCNGGQGVEKTRCGGCKDAIIDDRKRPIWKGIYEQQLELVAIADIGPGGKQRVERDLARCRDVLRDLGATDEELSLATA